MSTVLTGYSALFRNEDGTFSLGSVHSTEICAIASIHPFEGRTFYGIVPITADFDPAIKRKSGLQTFVEHHDAIKELWAKINTGEVVGFGTLVKQLINGVCPGK